MSEFRKAKIVLTAAYKSGEILRQDVPAPARVEVRAIPDAPNFRELSIRMVVDSSISEELLEGLVLGSANLSIEQMLSPLEREAKT